MKLLLTSAGITNPSVAEALEQLSDKKSSDLNVAIINEAAAVESGDKTWMFDELNRLRAAVGGEIDFVDLLALDDEQIVQRLKFADVVYVLGGNPDYLLSVFEKTGFSSLLREKMLASKVYVGSSAGSMVLGRRGNTKEYEGYFGQEKSYGTTDYMGVVDFIVKPHFGASDLPENHGEILKASANELGKAIYAIDDQTAIKIVDNEIEVISEGNWKSY